MANVLEHGFLRRAYKGSLAVFLVALLISLRWVSLTVCAGLAAGWLLALGVLFSWQLMARWAFDPVAPRPAAAAGFMLVKLPVLGALVWALIGWNLVNPIAFAVGFTLPQVTLAVLVAGRRLQAPGRPARPLVAQPAHDGGS